MVLSPKPPAPLSLTRHTLREGMHHVVFQAMGTRCELQFAAPTDVQAEAYRAAAVRWVSEFEAKYTRFRDDSLIGRINAAAGIDWVEIDADAERIFALCDSVVFLTRGVLDPTALPLMQLWNYKAERPKVPTPAEIQRVLPLVGWSKVKRVPGKIFLPQKGMAIDLGGFGKEYAVDRVAEMASGFGITSVLVDFGHDLRAVGRPPGRPCWHVGLEDPKKPGACWAGVALTNRGIASSGNYLRYFEHEGRRYGHILDPRKGYPVANEARGATVIATTCLSAGILSTAAYILGPHDGLGLIRESFGAEGCIVTATTVAQTNGFHGYLVTQS